MKQKIEIGGHAGGGFTGQGVLEVAHYCRRGNQHGFRITQKSYVDYEVADNGLKFNGRWETDIYFQWLTDDQARQLGLLEK